eukprot:CAMPEP_0184873884 /NCGR_PEP_ID=MMETSP0580-20130426/42083_1 /TAXON_ID=1118495 /ORGANISM="Dactyliosolen fragilissimus" /LENGTH=228 /DNA_ID=CAMNT_0027376825 /DNA_START=64 /DNA_END=747 /DNA_ORIENTATION=+
MSKILAFLFVATRSTRYKSKRLLSFQTQHKSQIGVPVLVPACRFFSDDNPIKSFSAGKHADDTPIEFKKPYAIEGTGKWSATVSRTVTGHVIRTDVPKSMGGNNQAPQPVEYLLASWIGCTQATAVFVGRNMRPKRINIDRLEFEIEAYRDERGALSEIPIDMDSKIPQISSRLQKVEGKIIVHLKGKEKEKLRLNDDELCLLREHTEARCPIANMMIASGCIFDVSW